MIRKKWHYNSAAAKAYFQVSDYHQPAAGEWIGRDAAALGLKGQASEDDFDKLLNNVNPVTGKSLTTFTRDGRRVAWELNFNAVKDASVAGALAGLGNAGDALAEWAHKEAVKYTLGVMERDMQARVRDDGKGDSKDSRTTGGMIAWRTTHKETRVNEDDLTPDPDIHDHVLIMNATFDPVAQKWKAIDEARIARKLPLYEALYHNRMAYLLRTEGEYGIARRGKSYRLTGVSDELRDMFSRRTAKINAVRKEIEEKHGAAMSAEAAGELGAKTRLGKTDLLEGQLHDHWLGKLSEEQKRQLASMKGQPSAPCSVEQAVSYAISDEFYRSSVVDEWRVYETAIRRGMGWVTSLDEVKEECRKQGLLVKDGEATTQEAWEQEQFITGLAMQRGSRPPLAPGASVEALKARGIVTAEHAAVCEHIWHAPDPVIVIEGDAGAGKTHSMTLSIPGIDKPGVFLAASGTASRGTLREKGFRNANTIAMFKTDAKLREQARGGYVYIDEAPMAGLSDVAWVMKWAAKNKATVILQGDRKQHQSPQRGNLFEILDMAGVPICRLTENHRQLHDGYKQAVNKVARGDILGGHRMIEALGWVQQVQPAELEKAVAQECWRCIEKDQDFTVQGITHQQNDAITGELRRLLREKGKLGGAEVTMDRLIPLPWTPAQKGDLEGAYDGSEVIQFVRNSGRFKAGQRVTVEELRAGNRPVNPECYAVYARGTMALAAGDVIRATAGGRTVDGRRIDNGEKFTFEGFTKEGNLAVRRGKSRYVVSKEFKHWGYGLVDTSFKAQSQTKAKTIPVFTEMNAPGINAAAYYVMLSRGRLAAKVITTLDPETLHQLIQRRDNRKSATELLGPKEKGRERRRSFVQRMRKRYRIRREQEAMRRAGRGPVPPSPSLPPAGKWQQKHSAIEDQHHGMAR